MARARYVLVLSGSIAEGNRYAKRVGLPRFSYRAVGSAKQVRNVQVADVHILADSFHARYDKHSILAALRYGRDIEYFTVEMPPALEAPPTDQGDGMGEQLTIDDIAELDAIEPFDGSEVSDHEPIVAPVAFKVKAVPDDEYDPPQKHVDMVKKVLPHKTLPEIPTKPERVLTPEQHQFLVGEVL